MIIVTAPSSDLHDIDRTRLLPFYLRDLRLRAGQTALGRPLGGWYSGTYKGRWRSTGDVFSTFVQWPSG